MVEEGTSSYIYFAKGCGGWVFASVYGVVCVDVEGLSVLSSYQDKDKWRARDRVFIAKSEMARGGLVDVVFVIHFFSFALLEHSQRNHGFGRVGFRTW